MQVLTLVVFCLFDVAISLRVAGGMAPLGKLPGVRVLTNLIEEVGVKDLEKGVDPGHKEAANARQRESKFLHDLRVACAWVAVCGVQTQLLKDLLDIDGLREALNNHYKGRQMSATAADFGAFT
eukprot:Platyproteum_vivax@DN5572_c0_g1_i5.p1